MLYFVQQFGRDRLQIETHRSKCCTKCNIEPQMQDIASFLLYKMQHLLSIEHSTKSFGECSIPQAAAEDERVARHRRLS